MKEIAFFDFDGTLTTQDSLKLFLSEAAGSKGRFYYLYYVRCFSKLVRMYMGKIAPKEIKEKRLSLILKSYSDEQLEGFSNNFADEIIPSIFREKGREKILFHQSQGHEVVIVSASVDLLLWPWCKQMGIGLITNEVSRSSDRKHIAFKHKDCNGKQKVERIKEQFDLEHYDKIYAYGDTSGDQQMLDLADEQFYRPFE